MSKVLKNLIHCTVAAVAVVVFAASPVAATPQDQINHGLRYLQSNQLKSGEIDPDSGFSKPTQWSAIAFSANGVDPDTVKQEGGSSLKESLQDNNPGENAAAIDWASKILAIHAAGGDPGDFGGIDNLDRLEDAETNDQLGDKCLLNDDIFGLLALIAGGDEASELLKQDVLEFIITKQADSGGFSFFAEESCSDFYAVSVDMTGAGLQALLEAKNNDLEHEDLDTAIKNATEYLMSNENSDGGFGGFGSNPDSTAWVLMALNLAGLEDTPEAMGAKSYLLQSQNLGDPCSESFGSFSGFTGPDTTTSAHSLVALSGQGWIVEPAKKGSELAEQSTNCEQPQPLPGDGSDKKQTDQPDQEPDQDQQDQTGQTTTEESGSQDNGEVSSASTTDTSQYITQLPAETTEEDEAESDSGETESQTDQPVDSQPGQVQSETQEQPSNNFVWYGLVALSLGAVGWYLLQTLIQRSKA